MSAPDFRLRPMTYADVPQVVALENDAFTNPWTQEMIVKELSQTWSTIMLGEEQTPAGWTIRGFVIFWLIADELHVLNVAVDKAHRRGGIGRRIMNAVLDSANRHKCKTAFLEVRASNVPAIGLYSSLGFERVGRRPKYYSDNQEDAVVMRLELSVEAAARVQDAEPGRVTFDGARKA